MVQEWRKGRQERQREHEGAQGRKKGNERDMIDWANMDKHDKQGGTE